MSGGRVTICRPGKPSQCITSHPDELSLAILTWVGAVNISKTATSFGFCLLVMSLPFGRYSRLGQVNNSKHLGTAVAGHVPVPVTKTSAESHHKTGE